jgi:FAD/FMN-containing dehydrogenase
MAVTVGVADAVEALRAGFRGRVVEPADADYDGARKLYNGMIDKRPRVIAQCADVADVIAALRTGRETGVDVAVRGGGHNGPGLGSVDDGLVIDLSLLRGVVVDPKAATAQVLGGTLLGEVDHATAAFGLAAPFGIISTTGAGGLTLGGGVGNLSRTLGLTIDNLVGADVALADGSLVHASEDENDDLFWALRGGGGNFGVVTRFEFRLSPIAGVVAGPTLWKLERAGEIMAWYRDFIGAAPDTLNGWFAFVTVPPVDPFPEHLHLQKMCGVIWCWAGRPNEADEAFAAVRDLKPDLDGIQPMPLPVINSAFDALYPPGDQWYWRTDLVKEIPDAAIEQHLEFAARLPTPQSTMHLYPVDGAASRVGDSDTAWPNREARWNQVMVGVDPDPAKKDELRDWAIAYWEALHPYAAGGSYVNMMMGDEAGDDRVRAAYGANYDRLAQIKAKYDPDNFFHVNQNIRPA